MPLELLRRVSNLSYTSIVPIICLHIPGIVECDSATSDVYYSGALLSEAFGNFTKLLTNGSGIYCSTAQEDNATLEVLLRAALAKLVDYSRIIVMRTASDFDRPYPGENPVANLFADQGGFLPAVANIYLAGIKVVEGVLKGWDSKFEAGIPGSFTSLSLILPCLRNR
jgi:purine nucleoside permease